MALENMIISTAARWSMTAFFVYSFVFSFSLSAANITVTADLAKTYQTITGLGSMVPSDDEIYDLGVSIVRMGWDPEYKPYLEPTNDNSDPNVLDLTKFSHMNSSRSLYEIAQCKKARAAGVEAMIATVWSPPTWMKDLSVQAYSNQNQWACPSIQGLCGGILRADMYDEFAEWIVGATLKFKEQAGFDLYAVGLQNEPEFPEPYGSCVYTPAQLRDAAIRVGRRFKALNIPTKIFIGEILPQQNHVVDFFKAVNDNTEAKDYVSAFAIHDYEGDAYTPGDAGAARWTAYYQECQRVAPKKELWMTETSGQPSSMTGGMQVSSFLYNGLRFGNISAWNHFGLNKNQNQVWQCYKNFFKYIKPGAVRFDAVPSTAALLCLGFTNPRSGAVTFILINTSTVSHTVTISASGGSMPQSFDVYTTSSTKNCAANGTAVQSNNYSVTVEPTSVNTLYHIDPSPIRRPLGSADRQDHIAIMVRGNVISLTGRMDGNKGLAVLDMHGKLIRKCDVKSGPVFSLKVKGLAKGTYIAALGQDGILSTQAIFTVN